MFKKKKKKTSVLKILFITFLLIKYHQISKLHSKAATGGVLVKKGVLKNFAKLFIGKELRQSLFLTKLQADACNLL